MSTDLLLKTYFLRLILVLFFHGNWFEFSDHSVTNQGSTHFNRRENIPYLELWCAILKLPGEVFRRAKCLR